eukprot:Hpha_TRINITY_DN6179_c0_g1::TRINITY_DN6179_c0_g1_i1::g.165037::m.165037
MAKVLGEDPESLCSPASLDKRRVPPPSFASLLGITAFNFPYGCICTTMGMFVLPAEAVRLWPGDEGVALGRFLLVVGLSQLVCPYTGLASDRCSSRWGRRRPYIVLGCAAAGLATVVMWMCSTRLWGWGYAGALLVAMVALNVVYSAQCGLVPDFVPEQMQGAASGVIALLQLAGSISGFCFVYATRTLDHSLCYPAYLSLIVPVCLLICNTAREKPLQDARPPPTWREVARSYVIDTSRDMDFFWVFMGRVFFYVAVSCQAFMLYYLRDALGTKEDADRRRLMAYIALVGQAAAAVVAYPVGRLSDKVGRKMLVYFACGIMTIVYLIFIAAPLVAGESASTVIVATAALYGVGNGCYLAVDYALALDCLPSKASSAQDLGIWGIAGFMGSGAGPMVWGAILSFAG